MSSTSKVVTAVNVEGYVFPPTVKAPGSHKPFFLGGSGVRGLEIEGKFVKFTVHGIYLEESAISALAPKWNGKTTTQLATCLQFFRDVITGPFEKLTQITMILPLTGKQFSEKVMENCVEIMKTDGVYGDDEVKAVEKFLDAFKDKNFPAGSCAAFTQSPLGSLKIGFGKHDSVPAEVGNVVIENKMLSEAVLDSIIGENGVNPEAKERLAATVSELLSLMNDHKLKATPNDATNEKIECTVVDGISGHQVVEA